jgi:hypothetical protein
LRAPLRLGSRMPIAGDLKVMFQSAGGRPSAWSISSNAG